MLLKLPAEADLIFPIRLEWLEFYTGNYREREVFILFNLNIIIIFLPTVVTTNTTLTVISFSEKPLAQENLMLSDIIIQIRVSTKIFSYWLWYQLFTDESVLPLPTNCSSPIECYENAMTESRTVVESISVSIVMFKTGIMLNHQIVIMPE